MSEAAAEKPKTEEKKPEGGGRRRGPRGGGEKTCYNCGQVRPDFMRYLTLRFSEHTKNPFKFGRVSDDMLCD